MAKRKKNARSIIEAILSSPAVRDGAREFGRTGGSSIAQLIYRYLYPESDEARERGAEAFRRYKERRNDPYQELGVTPGASDEVIRAAYKAEARRRHPDRGGSNEEMERLNAAFAEIKKQRGMK